MRTLRDYLKSNLDVVFVGINPSQYSVDRGHYYARPTNQFWRLLSESGLVREQLTCNDDRRILEFGLGLTDVVKRPTKSANELRALDRRQGAPRLMAKIRNYTPRVVAFNGKLAYRNFRSGLARSGASGRIDHGCQRELLAGAKIFVLPSTSPANARLDYAKKLRYFHELARWAKQEAQV